MIRLLETKMIVDNEVMDKIKALYRVKEEYLEAVFDDDQTRLWFRRNVFEEGSLHDSKGSRLSSQKISCIKYKKGKKNHEIYA